eukprot:TRINITY_DN2774_c0_g1_i1.p1 TRINITY_DN2774_c0_g1~~TRINITY_DN2774_c0_g1_i1.p1  ORF type:complete len:418 (-),score=85.80 TRINITY_DN2774_c0_g1_i1:232-1485(-)
MPTSSPAVATQPVGVFTKAALAEVSASATAPDALAACTNGQIVGKSESDDGTGVVRPSLPDCEICGTAAAAKYRCPACDRRTCCVVCVREHKTRFGCTGKRPRAEYVAPLKAFDDRLVMRDYNFLDDVDSVVDRANRNIRILSSDVGIQARRHQMRISLARMAASAGRRMKLIFAPSAFGLARSNTTKVIGGCKYRKGKGKGKMKGKGKGKGKSKGKGKDEEFEDDGYGSKPAYIAWRVEWRFGPRGQTGFETKLVDNTLPEHEVVGPSLARFLGDDWKFGPTRHLLLPYVEAGVDKLEVFLKQPPRTALPAELSENESESADEDTKWRRTPRQFPMAPAPPPFCKLDKSRTFRENLAGRSLVEFPVIYVALPRDVGCFDCGQDVFSNESEIECPSEGMVDDEGESVGGSEGEGEDV